jgi:CRISPR type III-B/RAMP module RAMP protein Cmr6
MSVAVPETIEMALVACGDVAPGHRFTTYFGGWWTAAAERVERLNPETERRDKAKNALERNQGDRGEKTRLSRANKAIVDSRRRLANQRDFAWRDNDFSKRDLEALTNFDVRTLGSGLLEGVRQRQSHLADRVPSIWRQPVTLTAPLATGLGLAHPIENGFAFLSPYGLPYLPGASVKGVLRRAAEELALLEGDSKGWTMGAVWRLFGFDANSSYLDGGRVADQDSPVDLAIEAERQRWLLAFEESCGEADPLRDAFLGAALPQEVQESGVAAVLRTLVSDQRLRRKVHHGGALDFWDVFPAPHEGKLRLDIMNPHQRAYLLGHGPPGTWEDPLPIFFLALPPLTRMEFFVAHRITPAMSCPSWKELLGAALEHAGDWLGLGAKTAAGYGRFSTSVAPVQVQETTTKHSHVGETRQTRPPKTEARRKDRPKHENVRSAVLSDPVRVGSRIRVRVLETKTAKGGWRFEVIDRPGLVGVLRPGDSPPSDPVAGSDLEVTVVAGGSTPQFSLEPPAATAIPGRTKSQRAAPSRRNVPRG